MKKCQPRLLTPFVDGELPADAREEMEEHLRSCATCGAMLDEVTQAFLHVRSMGRATIPLVSLAPAMELFAERAGLELGAPELRDTVEVARDPGAESMTSVVAPPPPMPMANGAAAKALDEDEAYDEELEPDADEVPEAAAEPDPADDVVEPEAVAEPTMVPVPEPMTLPPHEVAPEPEAAGSADAAMSEAPFETEPVDFHAEAPPHELRPPWLTAPEVEDPELEAEGRAAVDDAIEREAGGTSAADSAKAATEEETAPETDEPAAEGAAAEELDEPDDDVEPTDLTPRDPIPDPGPATRPEPRLEPPPEPWTTVWRPSQGTDVEAIPPTPEADLRPLTAAAMRFEVHGDPQPPAEESPADDVPADAPGIETHGSGWSDADQPLPEVEEAMARLRGDLREGVAEPEKVHHDDEPLAYDTMSGYRAALHERREPRREFLGLDLAQRPDQVKVAAVAAVVLLLVVAATTVALTSGRQSGTSGISTQVQPSAAASAATSAQASAAPSAAASPASTGALPQLTAPVTTGAGGSGYTATKIRGGSPGSGITRIVIEVSGSGPTPNAQLGRGPDGAAYLVASGISIDPAVIQAFKGSGLVTGISQVGASGTELKLTLSGSPQYAMTYLSSPSRLVIDFK